MTDVWCADEAPTDAPGNDCPDHGPYADNDCPKCWRGAGSATPEQTCIFGYHERAATAAAPRTLAPSALAGSGARYRFFSRIPCLCVKHHTRRWPRRRRYNAPW